MKKFLLLTALWLVSLICHADYNEGAVAYQQGDYQGAFKQWKIVAEQKSTLSHDFEWKLGRTQDATEAQYGLALLYWQGKGIAQNYHEAQKWLLSAANSGHSDAQLKLAYLYLTGLNGKKNPVEARKWFEKSAQQGNVDAQYNLGVLYKDGHGVTKDPAAAKKWLTLAAQQGDASAKALLTETNFPQTAEKTSSVVAQQAPDKPAEPQLIVAPYPVQDAPVTPSAPAIEKPAVIAPPSMPAIVQPVANKTPKPTLSTESISPPEQAVEKAIVITPPTTPVIVPSAPVQNAPVAQNDEHYAIQLLSSTRQNDTLAFIEHWHGDLNPLVATDKLKKSERVFLVAYGHYTSPSEAKQAIASLPDELKKNHPWVIKMRGDTFAP